MKQRYLLKSAVLLICFCTLFAIAIFCLPDNNSTYIQTLLSIFLMCAIIIVFIGPLFSGKFKNYLTIYNIFVLYYIIIFVFGAITILFTQKYCILYVSAMDDATLYNMILLALFYALIGAVAFRVGYFADISKHLSFKIPYFAINSSNEKRIKKVIIIYIGLGVTAIILYGPKTIIAGFNNPHLKTELYLGTGYIFYLFFFLTTGILMWFYYVVKYNKNNILFIIVLLLLHGMLIAFGGRTNIMQLWVAMLVIYCYSVARINIRRIAVIGLLVFFIFISFTIYRVSFSTKVHYTPLEVMDHASISAESIGKILSQLSVFDGFVAYLHLQPSYLPYQWGKTLMDFLIQPIPRALFPDKPLSPADDLNKVMNNPHYGGIGGTPFTHVGVFHYNFGVAGIIIGMFIFGIFCGVVDNYFRINHKSCPIIVVFYSIFFPRLFPISWGVAMSGPLVLIELEMQIIIAYYIISKGVLKLPVALRNAQVARHV